MPPQRYKTKSLATSPKAQSTGWNYYWNKLTFRQKLLLCLPLLITTGWVVLSLLSHTKEQGLTGDTSLAIKNKDTFLTKSSLFKTNTDLEKISSYTLMSDDSFTEKVISKISLSVSNNIRKKIKNAFIVARELHPVLMDFVLINSEFMIDARSEMENRQRLGVSSAFILSMSHNAKKENPDLQENTLYLPIGFANEIDPHIVAHEITHIFWATIHQKLSNDPKHTTVPYWPIISKQQENFNLAYQKGLKRLERFKKLLNTKNLSGNQKKELEHYQFTINSLQLELYIYLPATQMAIGNIYEDSSYGKVAILEANKTYLRVKPVDNADIVFRILKINEEMINSYPPELRAQERDAYLHQAFSTAIMQKIFPELEEQKMELMRMVLDTTASPLRLSS